MGNLIATIFGRLINLRSSPATTKPDGSEENEEEINDAETPQLPDTALRLVFKKLEFCDIENCRLDCTQWHRFALDNFKFMLAVNHIWPTEPGSNAIPASESKRSDSTAESFDQDRFRFKLVPFSAATDEASNREACESDRATMVPKPTTELHLDQLAAVINDSFKHKIYYVQLLVAKRPDMLPSLQAFVVNLPAAELICVMDREAKGDDLPGIWAVFERESGRQLNRPAKLRKVSLTQQFVERASLATIQLLANEAANIQEIDAPWPCIQKLLEHCESNNNGQQLLFQECQKLVCDGPLNPGSSPFLRISSHCRNVEELTWSAGRLDDDLDFANLERLTNLQTLKFSHSHPSFRVSSLFLPSSLSTLTLRCLLPDNPKYFVSSGLRELNFNADAENMRRLAAHARDGGNNLANVKMMYLLRPDLEAVQTFLRIILRTADRLERLFLCRWLPVAELETLFPIWTDIASVSQRLKVFSCPTYIIPDGFDCAGLIQRFVDRKRRTKLRARVSVMFQDNTQNGLRAALLARKAATRGRRNESIYFTPRTTETIIYADFYLGSIETGPELSISAISQDAE